MTQLIVNGQPQHFPFSNLAEGKTQDSNNAKLTVAQLLEHMALQGKRIAVERNGEIVPRSKFDQPILADGDRIEIVVAVGGG
ncbi:sulfur carrier protein ThiS [Nitrosovibrio tenuis]|uniref:Sulfur carrier protein n=1 Tax=Nitrosovibrio tenuis TaxID=1233 RepID=A0A1H7P330_9PROT|nr:sulfur carrier protein ThiS [Nitrosovibrio tenuis]SEL30280.1 sulfur carrier protein [Nitrosovibrio tenuis]